MLEFIKNNPYLITLLVAAIGAIPPLLTFTISIYNNSQSRKEELSNRQYTQYHQLVSDLASNAKDFAESQTAIIYELRFYRKYRHVTIRILNALKKTWEEKAVNNETAPDSSQQRREIDLAIKVLNSNPLSWKVCQIKERYFKA
jgi:ribosomal protein L16 Arg81 hydroxylase